MYLNPWIGAGIATALVALSGCLEGKAAVTQSPNLPTATAKPIESVNDSFDLETRYAISAAGMTLGDTEAIHYSTVPTNSSNVTLTVTWNAGLGVGSQQHCMVHDGTGKKMGTMLASATGASPLSVGPANLTRSTEGIGVMCWAQGDAAASVNQTVHVAVVFHRTASP